MTTPRRVLLLVATMVLVFSLAFGAIAVTVDHTSSVQQQIRDGQAARSTLLLLQLDQETGMRGYMSTRDRAFLAPYEQATAAFAPQLGALRAAAKRLRAPQTIKAIADLEVTHRRWLTEVAQPLIAEPNQNGARGLQLRGKQFIDRFRADDTAIARALDGAAAASDRSVRDLVDAAVVGAIVLGLSLLGFLIWFADRQHKLGKQLADQRRIEEQLERQGLLLEHERQITTSMQEALLASQLPVVPGLTLHARYRAAEDIGGVGGDWYDAFALSDGRLFITVGDVMGHGIAASATMSRLRHAILAAALQHNDPALILSIADRNVCQVHPEGIVGTAVCAFVDPTKGEIAYATAGHPPPVLVTSTTSAEFLRHGGTPLGIGVGNGDYQTHVAHAIGNALLVFYTDGLTELTRDIIAGEARLLEAAIWAASTDPADPALSLKQHILGEAPPHDDIAILTVGFTESRLTPSAVELNGRATAAAHRA